MHNEACPDCGMEVSKEDMENHKKMHMSDDDEMDHDMETNDSMNDDANGDGEDDMDDDMD